MNKLIFIGLFSIPALVFSGCCYDSCCLPDHKASNIQGDKLIGGWLGKNSEAVELDLNNGTVTISGVVNSEQEKQDVENKVKEFPQLKQVINNLQVKPADNAPAQ